MSTTEQEIQFDYQCKLCKELFIGEMPDEHIKKHNFWSKSSQSCHRCGRWTHNVYHDKPVCVQWCAEDWHLKSFLVTDTKIE